MWEEWSENRVLEASRTKEDKTDIFIIIIRNEKEKLEGLNETFYPKLQRQGKKFLKQFALNVSLAWSPARKIRNINIAIRVWDASELGTSLWCTE